jgi:hypothetical protein
MSCSTRDYQCASCSKQLSASQPERLSPRGLTSTCALSHLSILRDLTLEICVPSLRCSAAHRMHRKMPSYSRRQFWFAVGRGSVHRKVRIRFVIWVDLRSSLPILYNLVSIRTAQRHAPLRLTWVPRATVCACAVSRNSLDEILQGALITRLLAFVQGRRHIVGKEEAVRAEVEGRERQNVHESNTRGERGFGQRQEGA